MLHRGIGYYCGPGSHLLHVPPLKTGLLNNAVCFFRPVHSLTIFELYSVKSEQQHDEQMIKFANVTFITNYSADGFSDVFHDSTLAVTRVVVLSICPFNSGS